MWSNPVLLLLLLLHLADRFLAERYYDDSMTDGSDIRCGHPKYARVPCFDDRVKHNLLVKAGRTAVLQCIIYNAKKKVVTWDKKDRGLIAIDNMVFIRDTRYSIRRGRHTDWSLVIHSARPSDSGIYRCQINLKKVKEKVFILKVEEPERKMIREGDDNRPRKTPKHSTDEYLKDQGLRGSERKTVFITGNDVVYTGESLRLTCTARYRNPMSSDAVLEWYHYGIFKDSNRNERLTIRDQVINSTTLTSYLLLQPVTKANSGPWVCVKRPSEKNGEREHFEINITVVQPVYTVKASPKAVLEKNNHNASNVLSFSLLLRLVVTLVSCQYQWLRLSILDDVM